MFLHKHTSNVTHARNYCTLSPITMSFAGAYSQPECTDSTVVKGDIGRPLLLHCRLCSNPSTVTWELENGTRLLGQNNNYRIENVTTAVGGTTFVCRCSFDQDPQCFIVGGEELHLRGCRWPHYVYMSYISGAALCCVGQPCGAF